MTGQVEIDDVDTGTTAGSAPLASPAAAAAASQAAPAGLVAVAPANADAAVLLSNKSQQHVAPTSHGNPRQLLPCSLPPLLTFLGLPRSLAVPFSLCDSQCRCCRTPPTAQVHRVQCSSVDQRTGGATTVLGWTSLRAQNGQRLLWVALSPLPCAAFPTVLFARCFSCVLRPAAPLSLTPVFRSRRDRS